MHSVATGLENIRPWKFGAVQYVASYNVIFDITTIQYV